MGSKWTRQKGYKENSVEDWIIFYIDTGNSFSNVLYALTGIGDSTNYRHDSCPEFDIIEAREAIESMIADKTLARGQDGWLVVREWMPETAARIEADIDG